MLPSLKASASILAKTATVKSKAKAASPSAPTSVTSTGTTRRTSEKASTGSSSRSVVLKTNSDIANVEPPLSSLSTYSSTATTNLDSPAASPQSRLIQPKASARVHKSKSSAAAAKTVMHPSTFSATSKSSLATPKKISGEKTPPVEWQNSAAAREEMRAGRFIEYVPIPLESAEAKGARWEANLALPAANDAPEVLGDGALVHGRTNADAAQRASAQFSSSSLGDQKRALSSFGLPSRGSAPASSTLLADDDQLSSERINRPAGGSSDSTPPALPIVVAHASHSGDHVASHAVSLGHNSRVVDECPPLAVNTRNTAEFRQILSLGAELAMEQSPNAQDSGRAEFPVDLARSLSAKLPKNESLDTSQLRKSEPNTILEKQKIGLQTTFVLVDDTVNTATSQELGGLGNQGESMRGGYGPVAENNVALPVTKQDDLVDESLVGLRPSVNSPRIGPQGSSTLPIERAGVPQTAARPSTTADRGVYEAGTETATLSVASATVATYRSSGADVSVPSSHNMGASTAATLPFAGETADIDMHKHSTTSSMRNLIVPNKEAISLANRRPVLSVGFAGIKGEKGNASGRISKINSGKSSVESAKVRFKKRSAIGSFSSNHKPQPSVTGVASIGLDRKRRCCPDDRTSQLSRGSARRELSESADSVALFTTIFTTANIISWATAKGVDEDVIRALEKNAIDGSMIGTLRDGSEYIFNLFNFSEEKKQEVLDVACMFRADCDQCRRMVPIICGLDSMAEDVGAIVVRDIFVERLKHISAAEHIHGTPCDSESIWKMFAGSNETMPFKDFARVMKHYNGVLGTAFPMADELNTEGRVDQLLSHVTKLNHLLDDALADDVDAGLVDTDVKDRDAVSVVSRNTEVSRTFGARLTEANFLALSTKMTEMVDKFKSLREDDDVCSSTVDSSCFEDVNDLNLASSTLDAQVHAPSRRRLDKLRRNVCQSITKIGAFKASQKSHHLSEQEKKYLDEMDAASQQLQVLARESQFECAIILQPAVAGPEPFIVLPGGDDGKVVTTADLGEKLEEAIKALQCVGVTARAISPKQGLCDDHAQVTELKDQIKRLAQQMDTVLSFKMKQPCVIQQQESSTPSDYPTLCAPMGIQPPHLSLRELSPKHFGMPQRAFSSLSDGGSLTLFPEHVVSVVPSIGASRRITKSARQHGYQHVSLGAAQHPNSQSPVSVGGGMNKQLHFVVQQHQRVHVQWDLDCARRGMTPRISVSRICGDRVQDLASHFPR
eukprot:GEMP01001243.1.p1 GENE.GEMP01001243.1~~GEMP01001243.1.p1  ORF type:complete len:1245 (+),score=262.98 GEMP01001243.1:217-3951(+)